MSQLPKEHTVPSHIIAVHLGVAFVPLAAVVTLVYAMSAHARAGVRWPMLALNLAALAAIIWAGVGGHALLQHVTATASAAEVAAANHHAHESDLLTVSVVVLAVEVLVTIWWLLRPGRPVAWGGRVAAAVVTLTAVGTLAACWIVVGQGLAAAWSH